MLAAVTASVLGHLTTLLIIAVSAATLTALWMLILLLGVGIISQEVKLPWQISRA